jgi:hypothetical protein
MHQMSVRLPPAPQEVFVSILSLLVIVLSEIPRQSSSRWKLQGVGVVHSRVSELHVLMQQTDAVVLGGTMKNKTGGKAPCISTGILDGGYRPCRLVVKFLATERRCIVSL